MVVHSGTFGRTPWVVEFIGYRLVHSCAPHGVVGFIRVVLVNFAESSCPLGFVCYRLSSGSLGLVCFTPGVIWFIRSWLVWFIQERPGCRRVPSVSCGLFGGAPSVVRFIRVRLVHSGAPLWWSGSLRFVWFSRVIHNGPMVHLRSFGEFGRVQGVAWFIRVRLLC